MFSRSFGQAKKLNLPSPGEQNNISVVQHWRNKKLLTRAVRFAIASAFVAGCTAATPIEYTSDADTGSTHVLITIDRRDSSELDSQPRAAAFAGFVRTPPTLDQASVLRLAGLALDIPPTGECAAPSKERDPMTPLKPVNRVEFLDAGDVSLRVGSGQQTLAPRAFPAVTDLIAGVVYTTRDREADPLPAAVRYGISANGSMALGPVAIAEDAPALLDGVVISDVPFSELQQVKVTSPIQLTWTPGDARDVVYAELSADGGAIALRCTFRDDAGAGSIPAGAFAASGQGTLSLHRVRSSRFEKVDGAVASGEVRFDFERTASVRFEL